MIDGDNFWRERIQESTGIFDYMNNNRDSAYLVEMYPRESKILRSYVEEALDMEDYRGSFIYDEYPDKFLFLRMVKKIAGRYQKSATGNDGCDECKKQWIMELIQVILANEIYRRRNRRRYW